MMKTVFGKERGKLLAFLATVINCAAEAKGKFKRIGIVGDSVRKLFDTVGVIAEEVQALLRERLSDSIRV